jgi:hypothetical protein
MCNLNPIYSALQTGESVYSLYRKIWLFFSLNKIQMKYQRLQQNHIQNETLHIEEPTEKLDGIAQQLTMPCAKGM